MSNLIKAFLGGAVEEGPESVDLDGANDYLSRSSDLVGNTDSKTFTFSCFFCSVHTSGNRSLYSIGENNTGFVDFSIYLTANNTLSIVGRNAVNTIVLNVTAAGFVLPLKTFNSLVISMNTANSSERKIYLNDTDVTSLFNFATYTDDLVSFSASAYAHVLGGNWVFNSVDSEFFGRLSHIFLDYTYRDLSIEANRQLFVTEDLKPATGQEALNPIIYCPMKSPEDWFVNLGTGGDFMPNGTVATSQRGPNQDNCVASEFDGTNDIVEISDIGASDGKQCVFSASLKGGSTNRIAEVVVGDGTANNYAEIRIENNQLAFLIRFGATTLVYGFVNDASKYNDGINFSMQATCDTSDVNKRSVQYNGNDITADITWSAYTDATIPWSGKGAYVGGDANKALKDGTQGEFYFNTTYEPDLSIFWDSDSNRPKPVRQVIAETGVTPLVALPIRADNPGLNLGSAGDFTEVSAPFVGARGNSEFWARSVVVDGTNYLTYPSVLCASLIKAVSTDSGATWAISFLNSVTVDDIGNGTDNGMVGFYFGTSEVITWGEENKLRFVDALGYPIDIEVDSNTLIYHKFNDSSAFNENLGSVGNPTITGIITQGADVDP